MGFGHLLVACGSAVLACAAIAWSGQAAWMTSSDWTPGAPRVVIGAENVPPGTDAIDEAGTIFLVPETSGSWREESYLLGDVPRGGGWASSSPGLSVAWLGWLATVLGFVGGFLALAATLRVSWRPTRRNAARWTSVAAALLLLAGVVAAALSTGPAHKQMDLGFGWGAALLAALLLLATAWALRRADGFHIVVVRAPVPTSEPAPVREASCLQCRVTFGWPDGGFLLGSTCHHGPVPARPVGAVEAVA